MPGLAVIGVDGRCEELLLEHGRFDLAGLSRDRAEPCRCLAIVALRWQKPRSEKNPATYQCVRMCVCCGCDARGTELVIRVSGERGPGQNHRWRRSRASLLHALMIDGCGLCIVIRFYMLACVLPSLFCHERFFDWPMFVATLAASSCFELRAVSVLLGSGVLPWPSLECHP
jgi:hypothetical protein